MKKFSFRVEALSPRNGVAVAMMRRHGHSTPHTKKADKRAAQKARRSEANAY